MRKGKVYFVSAPGRIKIGYTTNPDQRLAKLRQVDMEELTTVAIVDGTRALERQLQEQLVAFRLRREWFRDCPEVRSAIQSIIKAGGLVEAVHEKPDAALDEAKFVAEASIICSRLILREKGEGATTASALSVIAIKTGLAHSRLWQLRYRPPAFVSAAEIDALRSAVAGPDNHIVGAVRALVSEDE